MTGHELKLVPSRLESLRAFASVSPMAKSSFRQTRLRATMATNPYAGYDAAGNRPFLYDGSLPGGIESMERVSQSR